MFLSFLYTSISSAIPEKYIIGMIGERRPYFSSIDKLPISRLASCRLLVQLFLDFVLHSIGKLIDRRDACPTEAR